MAKSDLPITAIRLRERMKETGTTQEMLAENVGATQGAISQILTGTSRNSRLLPKIADDLAVNLNWLIGVTDNKIDMFDAEGERIDEDMLAAIVAGHVNRKLAHPEQVQAEMQESAPPLRYRPAENDPDIVQIDHVEIGFGMGGGFIEECGEVGKRTFSRAWLREFTDAPPELLAWAKGDGDSMEPTIRDGEVVLIDRRFTQPGPNDQIWAVVLGDFGMIKRLRTRADGVVEIHSDNPQVPVAEAVDGELHVIGRVRAVVRRL